jgi:hypothetical protein
MSRPRSSLLPSKLASASSSSRAGRAAITAVLVAACALGCSRSSRGDAEGAGLGGVKGSGNVKSETRTLNDFSSIALTGQGEVNVTQGDADSVTIEAEDNILPELTTIVSGHRLTLGTHAFIRPTKPVRYTITMKELVNLELSGAGNVNASQLHEQAVGVTLSGAGNIKLSGQVEHEEVAIAGAGNLDASALVAKSANVAITGAGNAVVSATDELDARISGMGTLEYLGSPKLTQNITGLGHIRKR